MKTEKNEKTDSTETTLHYLPESTLNRLIELGAISKTSAVLCHIVFGIDRNAVNGGTYYESLKAICGKYGAEASAVVNAMKRRQTKLHREGGTGERKRQWKIDETTIHTTSIHTTSIHTTSIDETSIHELTKRQSKVDETTILELTKRQSPQEEKEYIEKKDLKGGEETGKPEDNENNLDKISFEDIQKNLPIDMEDVVDIESSESLSFEQAAEGRKAYTTNVPAGISKIEFLTKINSSPIPTTPEAVISIKNSLGEPFGAFPTTEDSKGYSVELGIARRCLRLMAATGKDSRRIIARWILDSVCDKRSKIIQRLPRLNRSQATRNLWLSKFEEWIKAKFPNAIQAPQAISSGNVFSDVPPGYVLGYNEPNDLEYVNGVLCVITDYGLGNGRVVVGSTKRSHCSLFKV